jgi:hypothetical protein
MGEILGIIGFVAFIFAAFTMLRKQENISPYPVIEIETEIIGSMYDGDKDIARLAFGENYELQDAHGVFLKLERAVDYPNRILLSVHMDRNIPE